MGAVPCREEFDLHGLDIDERTWDGLTRIVPKSWLEEYELTEQLFDRFGDRVRHELRAHLASLRWKLRRAAATAA